MRILTRIGGKLNIINKLELGCAICRFKVYKVNIGYPVVFDSNAVSTKYDAFVRDCCGFERRLR